MFKIGFSKTDLCESLTPKQEIREPIEAIAFYAEDDSNQVIWITLDFMDFNLAFTNAIRANIKDQTGLSDSDIHVLTTHNHGGGTPDIKLLAKLCGKCTKDAKCKARFAKMRFSLTKTDEQLNILRRLYIPEIGGVSTLYFGACEKNKFNSSLFAERVVEEIKEGKLCNNIGEKTDRVYQRFDEGDRDIFIIEFVDLDNEPIGSILRFAAHAVTANRPGSYSSDYPYYARRGVEEKLFGTCMFLNGPCAEIAPAMLDKYEGREQILGSRIASLAIRSLEDKDFTEVELFSHHKYKINLPVRWEVLENRVDIPEEMPSELPNRREYLEKIRLNKTLPFLMEKYSEGEEKLSEEVSVCLGALSFNEVTFAAFPGETFYKTGNFVKDHFCGKNLVTVTEHERTVMYLPPKEDFLLGGYEPTCKLTAPDSEKILREESIKALDDYFLKT